MIQIGKQLLNNSRVFAGVCIGVVAALGQAGVVPDWWTLVVTAGFTPFHELGK